MSPKHSSNANPAYFLFIFRNAEPTGKPIFHYPTSACSATPKSSRDPIPGGSSSAPEPPSSEFCGAALPRPRVPAFSPRLPLAASLGRVFFFFFCAGFLFPLRTPRVCVALSPRHNAPLHFLGRGLARASDLGGAESQGSRVTRGHRGQTKSLQPLM